MSGWRSVCVRLGALLCVLDMSPAALAAQPHTPSPPEALTRFSRVRSNDAELSRSIAVGYAQSQTFRALVDELQGLDAIVMVTVQSGACRHGAYHSCVLAVTTDSRTYQRHIRIAVHARMLEPGLIATIGHELHHAVEIVRAPEVRDEKTALAFYRRIAIGGCNRRSNTCETATALRAEEMVRDELYRSRNADADLARK
jgi:hypothetical protein